MLDFSIELCVHPHLEVLVGSEGLIFRLQEVKGHVSGVVICERNEVFAMCIRLDGQWSPEVRVYLISEVIFVRWVTDFLDRLASCFCIFAGLTMTYSHVCGVKCQASDDCLSASGESLWVRYALDEGGFLP